MILTEQRQKTHLNVIDYSLYSYLKPLVNYRNMFLFDGSFFNTCTF